MSQNPKGRPAKSTEEKKKVKQASDKRRYLERKVKSQSGTATLNIPDVGSAILPTVASELVPPSADKNQTSMNITNTFTRARNTSATFSEDMEDRTLEKQVNLLDRQDSTVHGMPNVLRWPKILELEQIFDGREIEEDQAFLSVQERRSITVDSTNIGNADDTQVLAGIIEVEEDQVLVRKSVATWPKVLGLEQILYDMEIRRKEKELSKVSSSTIMDSVISRTLQGNEFSFISFKFKANDSLTFVEGIELDEEGDSLLRLSHVNDLGYKKVPDLMIAEDYLDEDSENRGWL
ncbi:hypothetical protein HOY80DRAFT_1026746 [Tuber brumale]|nr:hypothetical protein HOY80DRAFT_1026746 [Tuber brumale]